MLAVMKGLLWWQVFCYLYLSQLQCHKSANMSRIWRSTGAHFPYSVPFQLLWHLWLLHVAANIIVSEQATALYTMTMIMSITCNLYANLHQLVSEAMPMHESSLIFPNPYQSIHVSQANRPIYISDPHPWQHLRCRAPYPTKYPRAVQCHDCLGGPLKT